MLVGYDPTAVFAASPTESIYEFQVLSCLLFDSCIAQGYFPTAGPILAPQKNLFPSPIPYARVPIIKYVNEPGFDGNYRYRFV